VCFSREIFEKSALNFDLTAVKNHLKNHLRTEKSVLNFDLSVYFSREIFEK
jgi:hypothetical protein